MDYHAAIGAQDPRPLAYAPDLQASPATVYIVFRNLYYDISCYLYTEK